MTELVYAHDVVGNEYRLDVVEWVRAHDVDPDRVSRIGYQPGAFPAPAVWVFEMYAHDDDGSAYLIDSSGHRPTEQQSIARAQVATFPVVRFVIDPREGRPPWWKELAVELS